MRFTIYSKEGCPYCERIEKVLTLANLDYKKYSLDENFTKEEFYSEFGVGSTFPQVILNDTEHIGGCVDTVKYLKEKNLV